MLRYLLCVWLAFASCANAGQDSYLTVTGSGDTFEQAKQNAFRKAIEFKLGVLVVSDLDVKNRKVDKDDIYMYSAGYVSDYRVLSQEKSSNVTVLLEVQVSESKLKNRILSEGKSGTEFAGDKHNAQLSTYLQEQQQGDKLLSKVLNDFPTKSFKIVSLPYTIKVDYQRKPVLNIPYELSWNFEYIKSLRETLDAIRDCEPTWNKRCATYITIMAKDPKDLLIGKKTEHTFNDFSRYDQVHNRFVEAQPRIVVRLYDSQNRYMYGSCYLPMFVWGGGESFYATGDSHRGNIYGNTVERGNIAMNIPLTIIDKISRIEFSVESKDICQTNR